MLSEFKYVIFFAVLLIGVPVGVIAASYNRSCEKVLLFLMVFFTCRLEETINFASHELYRGTSRGFEVGLVDLAGLTLFGVMMMRKEFKIRWFPPGTILYGIYFMFSVISIMNADIQIYSWFEVWKMVRMYFYYWVLYNYFMDFNRIKLVVTYLPAIVIYIFVIAVYQKYVEHIYQIHGPLPHQNSLSMYVSVLGTLFFAMVLNVRTTPFKSMVYMGTFCLCCMLEIATLSRAGLACYAGGCLVTLLFSYVSGLQLRKMLVTLAVIAATCAAAMFAMRSIIQRIETAPVASRITRYNLAVSALNMANDKFFGIGLNNFGLKVNRQYPYSEHFKQERYSKDFREGLVETTYLMIAAETGWLNLGVFFIFIMYFYLQNMFNIFRFYRHGMQFIAIGFAGGLSTIYIQSTLEWVLKQSCNFYQLMFVFAIVAAMTTVYRRNRGESEEQHLAMRNLVMFSSMFRRK